MALAAYIAAGAALANTMIPAVTWLAIAISTANALTLVQPRAAVDLVYAYTAAPPALLVLMIVTARAPMEAYIAAAMACVKTP